MPQTTESVAYMVEMALKEVVQNSLEHAHSTTDIFVLARWYQQDGNVRISIADSGEGFAESLRRNSKYSEEPDHELVRLAVTVEGTTGRTSGRFGGLGLKLLYRDYCLPRDGSVHVTSQVVDAHFAANQGYSNYSRRLNGTTVEIDFRPGPDDGSRIAEQPLDDFF